MTTNILYDIRNLKHSYEKDGSLTIDIDSLQINEGSVMGLVGPNGSGKSTLLKMLAFLEPFQEGTLIFDGADSAGLSVNIRRNVTYLLQDSYLLKRSIYENIAYGLKLRGETEGMKERIHDSLNRVGLDPGKFTKRLWYQLSGGEVQRVALAMRLALHPKVLLLDEPTANVDEASAQLVKEAAISAWKEWGTTVVVATHDLVWLYEVSTDVISLYQGRIIGHGAENIIQGTWLIEKEGQAVRCLSDGQKIYGTYGGKQYITAGIINPSDIFVAKTEQPGIYGTNMLKGTVTQMVLERNTGCVLVSAEVGDLIIKSRVSLPQIEKEAICPASTVWLFFPEKNFRWL